MKARTALVVISLVVAGLAAAAPRAQALQHLMKVKEVGAGALAAVEADFVELQMYQAAQNQVGTHHIGFFEASGAFLDCTIPANVPNPATQATILFATTQAETEFGVSADFIMPPSLHADGGAVCFSNFDCVTWGSFSDSVSDAKGAVINPVPGGIPVGSSILRDISGGNPLLVEDGDDTNNSGNDFDPVEAETPEPNQDGGNLGTLNCVQGTPGQGLGGSNVSVSNLKTKTPGNKAVVSGRIEPADPGGLVTLILYANGSPMRKVSKGQDTLDEEGDFRKRLPFPSDSTRCRVMVKYEGKLEAKARFAC